MSEKVLFTRRNLLTAGALATAGLLLPSIAVAEPKQTAANAAIPMPGFRGTLERADGTVLATIGNTSSTASLNSSTEQFALTDYSNVSTKSDGSNEVTYGVKLLLPDNSDVSPLMSGTIVNDEQVAADVSITVNYVFVNDGAMVKITSATGRVFNLASSAYTNARSLAVAQGPLGGEHYLDGLFTGEYYTITTLWDAVPYMATDLQFGTVLNGGECVADVGISGMGSNGDVIIRAEYFF